MAHDPRCSTRPRRSLELSVLPLEHRTLLSAAIGHQIVSIEVPGTYISQQSSQLDVTLVRTSRSGHADSKGPVTAQFTASYGDSASGAAANSFTPLDESVTFPQGQSSETVSIPVNPAATDPGLVAVDLAVTSSSDQVKGTSGTVYLANSADAIPPSIIGVQRVAGGIAVAFSKAMDPDTVQNIHNYAIKFSPSQNFNLEDLYGVGLVQSLDTASSKIALRRATYNPATNTVLLVATEQLGTKGAYTISNPPGLVAKKPRPADAHALSDTFGNLLDEGGKPGAFSIRIGKGRPYSSAQPSLVAGS